MKIQATTFRLALGLAVIAVACSESGSDPDASGGSSGTGGTGPATGGSSSTGGNGPSTGGAATGGGSSAASVTTLVESKVLGTLTNEESIQLCTDVYAYYASAISAGTICKWKAMSFAASSSAPTDDVIKQNCTTKETECLASASTVWNASSCANYGLDSACTGTVAQYSTCVKDVASDFTQRVSGLAACAALTRNSADTQPVWDIIGAEMPASCSFCPGVYPPEPRNNTS